MTKIKITKKTQGMSGCDCNKFGFPLCFPFGWHCRIIKSAKRSDEQHIKATKKLNMQHIKSLILNETRLKSTIRKKEIRLKAKQENE